eukprot:1158475-Pelagomonas_calceolata.AAC.3
MEKHRDPHLCTASCCQCFSLPAPQLHGAISGKYRHQTRTVEKKRLRKPGSAACKRKGPLTSKLAGASPRRFTGPA